MPSDILLVKVALTECKIGAQMGKKSFHVFILTRETVYRTRKVRCFNIPRCNVEKPRMVSKMILKKKQKQVRLSATTAGRTHVTRFVTNSSVNVFDVSQLFSMTKPQAKAVADKALAFCNTRGNRTFASVVSGKCDRGSSVTNEHKSTRGSTLFTSNTVSGPQGRKSTFVYSQEGSGIGVYTIKQQNGRYVVDKQELGYLHDKRTASKVTMN